MDSKKNKESAKESIEKSLRVFAPFMHIGLQMVLPIVLFAFLGIWLDQKMDSSPLFILLLTFFGLFSGFYYFFKIVGKKK